MLGQPGPEGGLDGIGLLVGHQPEGHLESRRGRDDGLDPRTAVAAMEADHFRRRPDTDPLDRGKAGLTLQIGDVTGRGPKGVLVERLGRQRRLLGGRQGANAVVEPREGHPAVVVVQGRGQAGGHQGGVGHRPSPHPAVQIDGRRPQGDVERDQTRASPRWWTGRPGRSCRCRTPPPRRRPAGRLRRPEGTRNAGSRPLPPPR